MYATDYCNKFYKEFCSLQSAKKVKKTYVERNISEGNESLSLKLLQGNLKNFVHKTKKKKKTNKDTIFCRNTSTCVLNNNYNLQV